MISLLCISFITTFITLPGWIRRATRTGFIGRDVHKEGIEVAELGGITVLLGVMVGLLLYIAFETFLNGLGGGSLEFLLAVVVTLLIATLIGMTDDMLGWRIGLRQHEKVLLTLLVPIPLVAVNAGHSMMNIPIAGQVDLGLLYPLLVIPLGTVGATNGFNMLAGYNGLEAGMGVITLFTLGLLSVTTGSPFAAVIAFSFVGGMVALLLFNRYPARVFPGDVFTYPVGAAIASVAILGNIERFAVMLFGLYFVELALKARGSFRPEWPADLLDDGSLGANKIYSVPHLFIAGLRRLKGRAYEYEVVGAILAAQLVIALAVVASFYYRL